MTPTSHREAGRPVEALTAEAWGIAREHVDWMLSNKIEARQMMEAILPGFAQYLPIIELHQIDITLAVAIAWTKLDMEFSELRRAA